MNRQKLASLKMVRLTAELRAQLAGCSTEHVVWHCHSILTRRPSEVFQELGLQSSYKQCWFLLGVLLGSPAPAEPKGLTQSQWSQIHKLLQEVLETCNTLLLVSAEDNLPLTEAERARYVVAVPEFIRYFNNGVLASAEQVVARAEAYLTPFDARLRELVGFSATDAVQMADWITARMQERFETTVDSLAAMKVLHERYKREDWSIAKASREVKSLAGRYPGGLSTPDPLVVERAGLEDAFGEERASAFWRFFVSRRGDYRDFTYFTEANPAEDRPLIGIDDGQALCPIVNALMVAILRRLSKTLKEAPSIRGHFLRRRDRELEVKVEQLIRSYFGPEAEVFTSVRETPQGQYEHDLIVIWGRRVLVLEAKASPPAEPFRDVERAFTRIRSSFRGNGGIQKAYEQTARITRPLRAGQPVQLYDARGALVRTITPDEVEVAVGVCVTADDFGVLATDLSLLLEKDEADEYPWAVNVLDLEAFLEALALKGWGKEMIFTYLASRAKLHGHAHPSDELEIAGMFLRHGRLPEPQAGTELWTDPEYAHIFDQIYLSKHGGPAPDLTTRPRMVIRDAGEVLRRPGRGLSDDGGKRTRPTTRVGRNDPCTCGSGRKFKKCCGRGFA